MFFALLSCTDPQPTLKATAPVSLNIGSSWGYPFLNNDQLHLGFGQRGDFWSVPLSTAYEPINEQRKRLTTVGRLTDHAFRSCPDGTYLLVSSDNISTPNYFFRFDSQLSTTVQGTLPQLEPPHAANDLSVICDQTIQGVAVAELKGARDYFWPIGAQSYSERIPLSPAPRMTGAALIELKNQLVAIGNEIDKSLPPPGRRLQLAQFDKTGAGTTQWLSPPDESHTQFWPTTLIPYQDFYLLLLMSRAPAEGWHFDTGNLYLGLLDEQLTPLSWTQLTHYTPPAGAMRPSMLMRGQTITVVYDKGNKLHAVTVEVE